MFGVRDPLNPFPEALQSKEVLLLRRLLTTAGHCWVSRMGLWDRDGGLLHLQQILFVLTLTFMAQWGDCQVAVSLWVLK